MNLSSESLHGKIARFGLVGLAGVVMNYAIFLAFFQLLGTNYLLAGIAGFLLPLPVVFMMNRSWTFQSSVSFLSGMPRYVATTLFSLGCHSATQWFVSAVVGIPEMFSQIFGIAVSAVISFVLAHTVVFRQADPTGAP